MLAASPMRAAENSSVKTLAVRVDPRTGKLARREIARHAPAAPPASISALVEQSAKAHAVDPLLVHSIIQVESNYDATALSPKGAAGLMQLMPPTARMLGVSNSFDPGENIEAGVKYLKYLQDLYKDDRLALAAYNAGPAAVDRYKQVPPYQETRQYVDKVGKRYQEARSSVEKKTSAVDAPGQRTPAEPQFPRLEQYLDQDGRVYLRTAP